MKLRNLLSGVSLAVLAFAAFETPARAQEQLPEIDVGAARPVAGGPGEGQGNNPGIEAAASGNGAGDGGPGGYGGAGPSQDPYNTSYVLPNASVGTRTDTPIMETPLNVQSIPQQVLQDQQVTTLTQALTNVSGVTFANQAGYNGTQAQVPTIRGFTASDIYRDGFRVDGGAAWTFQFANVADVQVLKGSGAMIYGFSEPGGVVAYTTRQPLDAPYYSVETQFGSFGNYRTVLDATGPLNTDKSLLYRIDMSYQHNGAPWGYPVDFVYDAPMFISPVLQWNIDAANWVKLEADYLYDRTAYFAPIAILLNGNWVSTPRNLNYGESSPYLQKNLYTALTWAHKFDNDWEFKQQFAYYRGDSENTQNNGQQFNISGGPASISNPTIGRQIEPSTGSQATYSSNAYLTGHINTFGLEHTLLLGGDFYKQDIYVLHTSQETFPSLISLLYPIHYGTSFVPGGPVLAQLEDTAPQDTGGLYAQDQIKLPYDVYFMAGARYQYIRQNGGLSASLGSFSAPGATTIGTADTETAVTPRFGLLWRPEQWVSFYANYAEGFSANTGVIYPDTYAPPTSSTSTEAGVKLESPNGKLRATLAYYDLTKTNQTVPDPNPAHTCPPSLGALSCSLVVGETRSKGMELDVGGELLPGWNVVLAYTNMDARITQTSPDAASTNQLGQLVPGVPRNFGRFTTSYEFQNDSPLKGLKIGGGVTYHGAQTVYANAVQPVGSPQWPMLSPWATVDLFAAYSFNYAGMRYTAQVNVNNLLDHTYYTDAYPFGGTPFIPGVTQPYVGLGQRVYGAPFNVLGSLKAEWPGVPSTPASSSPFAPSRSARPYSWTGFYVGGQIGYGFGDNFGNVAFTTPGGASGNPPLVGDASGLIGGAHLGYNWQTGPWVMGVEGTIDGANLSKQPLIPFADSPAYPLPGYNPNTYLAYGGVAGGSVASNIQGALRLRAGYAWDRLLFYGAAGAAAANFSTYSFLGGQDASTGNFYFAADNRSTTRLGWTFGGGLEYGVNDHWSVRGEYRFSDFGQLTDTPLFPGLLFTTNRQLAQHQVQVGFSYKFVDDSLDAADFKALAPLNSLQSQSASQSVGKLGLPGSAQAASSAAAKPPAAPAKPVAPPTDWTKYTWTGVYLGFQAGYAWGDNSLKVVAFDTSTGSPFNANVPDTQAGWIGGAHLGYNYQIDRWVVGLEGSVDTTSFSRTTTLPVPFGGSFETAQTKSDVQATIRGRVGFAWDRALIYGAAGVAWERFDTLYGLYGNNSGNPNINGGGYFLGSNEIPNTRVGWTVGGGVEYVVNDHWSVRGEYRYTNFGTFSNAGMDGGALEATPGLTGSFLNANRQLALNQVEVGFSYKFGAAAPEPAPAARIVKGPAVALGSPPVASPSINWTGFYVGGQIGYAWGDNHGAYTYGTPGGWVGSDPLIGDAKGIIVGGHLGYNRQLENWVVGLEGSVDGANLVKNSTLAVGNSNNNSNFAINGTSPANAVSTTVQSDIQGALRVRAGYAFGRLLTFASAGVAVGDFSYQSNIAGYDPLGFFAAGNPGQTVLRVGCTVGGGVEWAVNNNWSVRGEYRYADFGNLTDAPNQIFYPGSYYTGSRHLDQNQVQFGFNYKFGDAASAPVIAKY
jgi:iron complex outermembrane receptor protein